MTQVTFHALTHTVHRADGHPFRIGYHFAIDGEWYAVDYVFPDPSLAHVHKLSMWEYWALKWAMWTGSAEVVS